VKHDIAATFIGVLLAALVVGGILFVQGTIQQQPPTPVGPSCVWVTARDCELQ